MATKNIEIQDSTGNIYYPHTDASIVKFGDSNVNATLSDRVYQTASGSATAITLTIKGTLVTGYPITFIASTNNGGASTTINGKKLYKPGTTTSPNLIAGKAYTVWYNSISDCFFIKASAEGDADVSSVLATKKFSNDNDTGLVGTMPNNGAVSSTLTNSNQEYIIPAGFHNGLGKIKVIVTNLAAEAIKAGTTVGGIVGTFTSDANATASDIANGKIAYINGNKVTGTLTQTGSYINLAKTQYETPVVLTDPNHTGIWQIIFDSSGNYYTAGTNGDAYVRKFSPNGTMLWQTATNGQTIDIALDPTENYIYTAEDGFSVRKLACSNGAQSWVHYDPTSNNWIYAVDVDSVGNVYAGGNLSKLYKFNSNGDLLATFNTGMSIAPRSLSIDSANNIYIGGTNYIKKFTPTGSNPSNFSTGLSGISGLVIDGLDNIYYIGNTSNGWSELHVMDSLFVGVKRNMYPAIYYVSVNKKSNTVVIATKDSYNGTDGYIHRFDSSLRQLGSINFQARTGSLMPVAMSNDGVVATVSSNGLTLYNPQFKIL